jgi:hypothetical protein
MSDTSSKYDETHPCEGSAELNGKDASYRTAKMISDARPVLKRRVRGALVPMGYQNESPRA